MVDGEGPYEGSALLWASACAPSGARPARSPPARCWASPAEAIAAVFRAGQDNLHDPERRAKLWDDLAKGMLEDYGGAGRGADRGLGRASSAGPGGAARPPERVRGLRRPAAQEGLPRLQDLRAPRLARGHRPGELGGLRRQRADAAGAALRASSPGRGRGGARGDPRRLQAGGRGRRRSRRRSSTTCSGSRAARTRPARRRGRRLTRAAPAARASSSTSDAMRIPRQIYDELLAHAREEAPNECCGMIGGADGVATTVYRARNAEASPLRYNLDPQDQFRIMTRDGGERARSWRRSTTPTPRARPIPRRPTSTSPPTPTRST